MQVIIQAPHTQVSADLEKLIHVKAQHLKKLDDRITKCLVLAKTEKQDGKTQFYIEIELRRPTRTLFAIECKNSFEEALHAVMHQLEGQLRKSKTEREEIW